MEFADKLALLPVVVPALVLSLVLHEMAHGWAGHLLGDTTPKEQGRLNLNPIRHIDPVGAAFFIFTFLLTSFPFGWAKPVQIDTKQLRGNPQRNMAVVAAAGPLTNFLIAFAFLGLIVHAGLGGIYHVIQGHGVLTTNSFWDDVIIQILVINIVLGVFNLIPVPPLDGSRIVGAVMSKAMYEEWSKLDKYAPIFLMVLIFFLQDALGSLLQTGFTFVLEHMFLLWGVH